MISKVRCHHYVQDATRSLGNDAFRSLLHSLLVLVMPFYLSFATAQTLTPLLIELDVGREDNKISALVWSPRKSDVSLLFFRGTPGKDAVVKINSINNWERQFSFLQPSLGAFADAGISVALISCPTDQQSFGGCYDDYRKSVDHAKDVKLIINKLKADVGAQRFYVMGHSSGNISSKWLSLNLKDELAGSINSAAMTSPYGGLAVSIANFDMNSIDIPVLNIHHQHDGCPSSPYLAVKRYSKDNLVTVRGGGVTGSPCANKHYHSYEDRAVQVSNAIIRWIKTGQVERFVGE